MQMTKISNICTHRYPNIHNKVSRLEEDKLTLVVKTGSIKALSILMGEGQFQKFTSHSSSRVFPLFYILSKVNIDVKI